MTLLFTNARLIDPEAGTDSPGHLLVQNGKITEVFPENIAFEVMFRARNISPEDVEIIDCKNRCLAPGIVDIGVKVCEPGAMCPSFLPSLS